MMTAPVKTQQSATAPSLPASQYSMTYRDLDTLPDYIKCYELWEGELIMSPAPTFDHQTLVMNLLQVLTLYDVEYEKGRYVPSPVDVVLRDDITVQPDIVYLVKANLGKVQQGRVMGAPDLCVEILSPSTSDYDLNQKRRYYEDASVREYWLVDPAAQTLTVHSLAAGTETRYDIEQTAVSTLPELEGLQVDIAKLFAAF